MDNLTVENKITENGLAECIFEPRGDNGLEGYRCRGIYKYERLNNGKRTWYRVYPDKLINSYFETCGRNLFAKYFKKVTTTKF